MNPNHPEKKHANPLEYSYVDINSSANHPIIASIPLGIPSYLRHHLIPPFGTLMMNNPHIPVPAPVDSPSNSTLLSSGMEMSSHLSRQESFAVLNNSMFAELERAAKQQQQQQRLQSARGSDHERLSPTQQESKAGATKRNYWRLFKPKPPKKRYAKGSSGSSSSAYYLPTVSEPERKDKLIQILLDRNNFEQEICYCGICFNDLVDLSASKLTEVVSEFHRVERFYRDVQNQEQLQKQRSSSSFWSLWKSDERESIQALVAGQIKEEEALDTEITYLRQKHEVSDESQERLMKNMIELERELSSLSHKSLYSFSYECNQFTEELNRNLQLLHAIQLETNLWKEISSCYNYHECYQYLLRLPYPIYEQEECNILHANGLVKWRIKRLDFLTKGIPLSLAPLYTNIQIKELTPEQQEQHQLQQLTRKRGTSLVRSGSSSSSSSSLSHSSSTMLLAHQLSKLFSSTMASLPSPVLNINQSRSFNQLATVEQSPAVIKDSGSASSSNNNSKLMANSNLKMNPPEQYAVLNGRRLCLCTLPVIQLNWGEINAAFSILASHLLAFRNLFLLGDASSSPPEKSTAPSGKFRSSRGKLGLVFNQADYYFPQLQSQVLAYGVVNPQLQPLLMTSLSSPFLEMKLLPLHDRVTISLLNLLNNTPIPRYLHVEGGITSLWYNPSSQLHSISEGQHEEEEDSLCHYYRSVYALITAIVFTKLQLYEPILSFASFTLKRQNIEELFLGLFSSRRLLMIAVRILLNLPLGFESSSAILEGNQIMSAPSLMKSIISMKSEDDSLEDILIQIVKSLQGSVDKENSNRSQKSKDQRRTSEVSVLADNRQAREEDYYYQENISDLKEDLNSLLIEAIRIFSDLVNV